MSNNRTDIILLTNYYWLTAEDGTSMAHVFCGLIDKLSSVRCNMNTASDLLLSLFDLTFTVWWRDGGLLAWTVRPHAFAAGGGLCHDLGAGPSTPRSSSTTPLYPNPPHLKQAFALNVKCHHLELSKRNCVTMLSRKYHRV